MRSSTASKSKGGRLFALSVALVFVLAAVSLFVGKYPLTISGILTEGVEQRVFLRMRLPRMLVGLFGGFALGAAGSAGGLPVWAQTLASLLNFSGTSQTAIVRMAGDAGILAIVLACVALNLRYILLSLAIAQRLAGGHGFWHRCLIAGCVTDEVVAMSLLRTEPLRLSYLLGLAVCSLTGWVGGTACGAWGAGWLPPIGTACTYAACCPGHMCTLTRLFTQVAASG